jgi:hypothetical protein
MYHNYKISIIVFTILFNFCNAQGDKERIKSIFTEAKKKHDSEIMFKMNMIYTLYATPTTKVKSEEYSGVIVKKNKMFYSRVDKSEKVILDNFQIKVDFDAKLMQINKVDKRDDNELAINSLIEMINNFKDFKLDSDSNFWICSLSTGKLTMVPYHKIIVYINKLDNTIYKQELYYLEKYPYKDAKKNTLYDFPRLVITFDKPDKNITDFEQKFLFNHYVKLNKKPFQVSKEYQSFRIID